MMPAYDSSLFNRLTLDEPEYSLEQITEANPD